MCGLIIMNVVELYVIVTEETKKHLSKEVSLTTSLRQWRRFHSCFVHIVELRPHSRPSFVSVDIIFHAHIISSRSCLYLRR